MLAPRISPGSTASSLTIRLILLLSLILLPIGAIAIYQTWSLEQSLKTRAANAILARTIKGVAEEGLVLERAAGAVEALSLMPIEGECDREAFRRFTQGDHYVFAGRLELDLMIACSSSDQTFDASDNERFVEGVATEEPFALSTYSQVSQKPVMIFAHPVRSGEELSHYVLLTVATESAIPMRDAPELDQSVALYVFDDEGMVLSAEGEMEERDAELPSSRTVTPLARDESRVFTATSNGGEPRVYAVVPLHDGLAYAAVVYPISVLGSEGLTAGLPAWFLPLLMWLGTLVVVYVAISRLVVIPVRHLARRMRRFAQNRAVPAPMPRSDLSAELQEMNTTFETMADAILRDEAELENALREKSILVREIHHRVKNNLQLIASIMNMQVRKSRASETSAVVRRLQERVLGLATVHRQMYESASLTDVEIAPLLSEILRQILRQDGPRAPTITTELAEAELIPDQAVPLALLAAEAAMNAIRYVGFGDGEKGWIEVRFTKDEDGQFRLSIANSVTHDDSELADIQGDTSGLGTQLIQAFAAQLGGRAEVEEGDHVYKVSVAFTPSEVQPSDAAAEVIEKVRVSAA